MRVQFYSKGPIDQVSGGYLYNRRVLGYLEQRGVDVVYHAEVGLLQAAAADIVIVDSLVAMDYMDPLLAMPGKPLLLLHMLPPGAAETSGQQRRDLVRLLQRSGIIVTGSHTEAALHEIAAGETLNIAVIEPGVAFDATCAREYAHSATRLLYLANYVPGKGQLTALRALRDLHHLEWALTMRGNRDLAPGCYDTVRQFVAGDPVADRVDIGGPVSPDNVRTAMNEADLLLQFSEHESYSIVTAEAIACGLPVMATKTGNWQRFVESGLVTITATGDADKLTQELGNLVSDASCYGQLRPREGWSNRLWDDVGREFFARLEQAF